MKNSILKSIAISFVVYIVVLGILLLVANIERPAADFTGLIEIILLLALFVSFNIFDRKIYAKLKLDKKIADIIFSAVSLLFVFVLIIACISMISNSSNLFHWMFYSGEFLDSLVVIFFYLAFVIGVGLMLFVKSIKWAVVMFKNNKSIIGILIPILTVVFYILLYYLAAPFLEKAV